MSMELAMITGLGIVAFMTVKILEQFKSAESMLEEATSVLSIFFLIGLQYAAYGIADSNSLSNSKDAYIIALLISVLIFIGLLVQLILRYRRQTRKDNEFGYFNPG